MKMSKVRSSTTEGALRSLTDEAYRLIEAQIVTLKLAPGEVVTEQVLCKRLNIGRTPVREAIVRLKHDGLVSVMPQRGILIKPIDTAELLMTLEVRHLIEFLIVERASKLSTDVDRRRFLSLAEKMELAANNRKFVEFMQIDESFNRLVARCAQHPVAEKIILPLHAISRRLGFYYAQWEAGSVKKTGDAHANLMRAIAAGDVAGARRALEVLLSLSRDIALKVEEHLLDEGLPPRRRRKGGQ